MTIAQTFIKKLQDATAEKSLPKFCEEYSSGAAVPTFQAVLDKYAEYYNNLPGLAQKKSTSEMFWEQVKALGTPIIENHSGSDDKCDVYFLFPKDKISDSKPETKDGFGLISMSCDPVSIDRKQLASLTENKPCYLLFNSKVYFVDDKLIPAELTMKATDPDFSIFPAEKDKQEPATETQLNAITSLKDLYLQGDFHGYGSTDGRQRLLELSDTGIMWHKDNMPSESIVVYKYIEVEPVHRGIKPVPELSPFFEDGEGCRPVSSKIDESPEIPQRDMNDKMDEYSTHSSRFPGFDPMARIFRVNADSKHAHIPGKPINWPSLLSTEAQDNTRHFVYQATLFSDQAGDLQRSEEKITTDYHDKVYFSDQANSPYANFTRDIHVFKPADSGKIDDIIVVNDGRPYLMTGILDHFEKMVDEKKLSPNTAFVFIDSLPGLKTTLSTEAAKAFDKDPSANLPGMGVRLIDYRYGIDQYTDFIAKKLFPQLKKEINVPDDPSHRVMTGSSLSGTASVYIGSKCRDLFGAVIALSPSPNNRAILSTIPSEMLKGSNIHLGCGEFEQPKFAAANDNLSYAQELSKHLGKELHVGAHGHEFVAWNEELEKALPAIRLTLDTQEKNVQTLTQKDTSVMPVFSNTDIRHEHTQFMRSESPIPQSQSAVNHEKTRHYRDKTRELRQSQPGYMAPTESSEAKKKEIFNPTPVQTIPKPPWKP